MVASQEHSVADAGYFLEAARDWQNCIEQMSVLLADEYELKAEVGKARRDLEGFEAEWALEGFMVPGGAGDVRPAKNEVEREAVRTLRRRSGVYATLFTEMTAAEMALAGVQRRLVIGHEQRALLRRRMEYATATRLLLARDGERGR